MFLKAGAFIPHPPVGLQRGSCSPGLILKALPRCSLRFPRSALGLRSPLVPRSPPGPVPPAPWRHKIPSLSPQVAANTKKFIRPPRGASPAECEATRATRARDLSWGGLGPAGVTPAASGVAPGGAALEGTVGTCWILFSTFLCHPEPPSSQIVTWGDTGVAPHPLATLGCHVGGGSGAPKGAQL